MNLQKSENPASAPVFHLNADPEARPEGRWTDRQLSFGLQARDALHRTYVFYEWEADAYPGFMGLPWLHIRLDHQSFCFGNWWGWKIQFNSGCNLPNRLTYAILLEKKDDQSNWVLDPFSRVCAGGEFLNFSGCGNTFKCAEPWDAVGGYRLGYPSKNAGWAEWNDFFRDTVRKAVRGDEGQMTALKEAILRSLGKFSSTEKGREFSINFITSPDGMTFNDLVSYNHKHNLENGEENRDGHNSEFSFNCGIEGPTKDAEVLELILRKIRLMHFLLQVSNGIPMMLAVDEMLWTQLGNNNAYCHDFPLTWVDWTLADLNSELVKYVGSLIDFREKNFEFLFSETSHCQWFNAIKVQESL